MSPSDGINARWEGLNPPYATIVADPPWHYEKSSPDMPHRGYIGRGLPYSSMTLDEISALPVAELAQDSRLYLWTTNRYLRHAWSVVEAWGFEPQDRVLVWCKAQRGTTPVTTEFVLIGKRGRPPKMPWHGSTWFAWPLTGGGSTATRHSVKPPAFYDLVERWSPGPYVDIFCRNPRFGWDSWGYGYEGVA